MAARRGRIGPPDGHAGRRKVPVRAGPSRPVSRLGPKQAARDGRSMSKSAPGAAHRSPSRAGQRRTGRSWTCS